MTQGGQAHGLRTRAPLGWILAAALLAACSEAPAAGPVEPEPPPTGVASASGTVFTLQGPLPAGLRVYLETRSGVSSPVAPDGRFEISGNVSGATVSVIIDAASGTARQTFPALVQVPSAAATTNLRIVLVPMRWTVDRGTFAGTTVDLSMDGAFRPPCDRPGDTNCDGFFPSAWLTGIRLWGDASLPARLALHHDSSHRAMSAPDSAQMWTAVNRMNADAGMPLFRPARQEEINFTSGGSPTNGVVVRIDTTIVGFGAWANWWWNANGDMVAGLIRPRDLDAFRRASLMTHELFHTQGLKHSCSWNTVMGGYGCGTTQGLSVSDVAHFHLARAVLAAQRQHSAPHGLVAALQGERVILRNLPLFAMPDLERIRAMRSDSIGDGDHAGHRHP